MTKESIIDLLKTDTSSEGFYRIISESNSYSRKTFGDKGYVFAQIGINAEPCSKGCRFCSMASGHYSMDGSWKKSTEQILEEVKMLIPQGINDLFLMTTADYPLSDFIEIARKVRSILPDDIRLVANTGDFDAQTASPYRDAGVTGAYHIRRLREGEDTLIDPSEREKTIENILNAGLELYYCIEPIGPEHSYEEIANEILFAKQFKIEAMAVMRRTPVLGTPLYDAGQITASELAKIAAVTNLAIRPSRSMNVHEPNLMSLLVGVNQLYAESGANPRDVKSETEKSRGFTPEKAWGMLTEAGWCR